MRGRSPGEATGGFHPWDVLAAAAVTHPGLFAYATAAMSFDVQGRTQLGRADGAVVSMTTAVNADGFRALFLSRIGAPRIST